MFSFLRFLRFALWRNYQYYQNHQYCHLLILRISVWKMMAWGMGHGAWKRSDE